jgi:tetratricopeptide (TPR) repeat protein
MRKFNDAREIFNEVIRLSPNSFEGHFNLGLAHEGLRNYPEAVAAFRRASQMNPYDTDTNYELGVCLSKSGDREGAIVQYEILRDKDAKAAEKLRRALKLDVTSIDPPPAKIVQEVRSGEKFKIGAP